jgi:hypothetical protein
MAPAVRVERMVEIDVLIFRLDRVDIARALEAAVGRGVAASASPGRRTTSFVITAR